MEKIKVFDEQFQYIGIHSRDHVHSKGLWHETFHCWLIDDDFVYIQKRSAHKKDFPSLFDITAAGHLEAHETVEDGVREIEEELGIKVAFTDLISVGIIRDIILLPHFSDYEFAHVYFYQAEFTAADFTLQEGEVESIYRIKQQDFIRLCVGEVENTIAYRLGNQEKSLVSLTDFVPHETIYFQTIAEKLVMD